MIGKIKGTLIELDNNAGLIETLGGISYHVYLPSFLISTIEPPTPIEVYTYLQVREDTLTLFGFPTKKHLDLFKMLLTVPNVGPKTAFSIISFCQIDQLINAIKENNNYFFTQIPGLGKKTGMKIILELAPKLKSEFELEKMHLSEEDKTVIEALVSLGVKTNEAKKALSQLPKNLSLEEKIKKALKMVK